MKGLAVKQRVLLKRRRGASCAQSNYAVGPSNACAALVDGDGEPNAQTKRTGDHEFLPWRQFSVSSPQRQSGDRRSIGTARATRSVRNLALKRNDLAGLRC